MVKQYSLDGKYKRIQPLQSVFSTLCCSGFWGAANRNTNIRHTCALNPKAYDKSDMRFYELFFVDRAVNQSRLINVPIRNLNFARMGIHRNKASLFLQSKDKFFYVTFSTTGCR